VSAARASLAPPAVLGVVALAQVGAIAIAGVAWNGSATKASPTGQISWAGLAALAVAVSGAVNALWLARARRIIGIRQRQVTALIQEVGDRHGPPPALGTQTGGGVTLVAVDGMGLYHRAGCVLLQGRPGARAGHAADHESAGRRPCGWCLLPRGSGGVPQSERVDDGSPQ
jgi:hypothetical protein